MANVLHEVRAEQIVQGVAGVRGDGHAGTDLAEFRRLLVDGHPKSGPLQCQCRGQAADARPDDQRVKVIHVFRAGVLAVAPGATPSASGLPAASAKE